MFKASTMKNLKWILLFSLYVCVVDQSQATDYSKIPFPQSPYTPAALRAWHKAMQPWPWSFAPEQQVHLSDRGGSQLLLAFAGGARSGEFALFAQFDGAWQEIGQIGQAHHPVYILPRKVSGWHDFETFVPLWGSGGHEVLVIRYRWNGKKYAEASRSEGMFCDYEPFKSDAEFADLCR